MKNSKGHITHPSLWPKGKGLQMNLHSQLYGESIDG